MFIPDCACVTSASFDRFETGLSVSRDEFFARRLINCELVHNSKVEYRIIGWREAGTVFLRAEHKGRGRDSRIVRNREGIEFVRRNECLAQDLGHMSSDPCR